MGTGRITARADRFLGVAFRLMFALYCEVLGSPQGHSQCPEGRLVAAEGTSVVSHKPWPDELTDYDNSTALSKSPEVP